MFDTTSESLDILIENLYNAENIKKEYKYYPWQGQLDIITSITKKALPNLLIQQIGWFSPITKVEDYLATIKGFKDGMVNNIQILPRHTRLCLRWEFECIQNRIDNQGWNPTEVTNSLAKDLVSDLDRELISQISCSAEYHRTDPIMTFEAYKVNSMTQNYEFPLTILINREANMIAKRTKHMKGNWCIVNKKAYDCLMVEYQHNHNFQPLTQEIEKENYNLVGMINNSIMVYLDKHASDMTPVLIGYKNNDVEADASVVHATKILVDTTGVIIDPATFEPVATFKTHSGYYSPANSVGLVKCDFDDPANLIMI